MCCNFIWQQQQHNQSLISLFLILDSNWCAVYVYFFPFAFAYNFCFILLARCRSISATCPFGLYSISILLSFALKTYANSSLYFQSYSVFHSTLHVFLNTLWNCSFFAVCCCCCSAGRIYECLFFL